MFRIFDIFKRKSENKSKPISLNNNLLSHSNKKSRDLMETLNIHPDIKGLLWIENSTNKKIDNLKPSKPIKSSYSFSNIKITFISPGAEEPSLIDMSKFIKVPKQQEDIPKLTYYPSYKELTPEQKYMYWKFLANPYDVKANSDIGNLFILYYGLERHLFEENIENAVKVIIKLRTVYDNSSFHYYSGNAIILACLYHQRTDLMKLFLESLSKLKNIEFSTELYLLALWSFEYPLYPRHIMNMAKKFGFTKYNYIKNYPTMFIDKMNQIIKQRYNKSTIYPSNFITDLENLPVKEMRLFANTSLIEETITIKNLLENKNFTNELFNLLDSSHESVKKQLVEMRKRNLTPTKKVKKQHKKKLEFDYKQEGILLDELKTAESNPIRKHFAYMNLHKFYYKYRALHQSYLYECINYCKKDIQNLEALNKAYVQEELRNLNYIKDYRYNEYEYHHEVYVLKKQRFNGSIPAFSRLAIIYEKQKEYVQALEIVNEAINYYTDKEIETLETNKRSPVEFKKRLVRIKRKMNK